MAKPALAQGSERTESPSRVKGKAFEERALIF